MLGRRLDTSGMVFFLKRLLEEKHVVSYSNRSGVLSPQQSFFWALSQKKWRNGNYRSSNSKSLYLNLYRLLLTFESIPTVNSVSLKTTFNNSSMPRSQSLGYSLQKIKWTEEPKKVPFSLGASWDREETRRVQASQPWRYWYFGQETLCGEGG